MPHKDAWVTAELGDGDVRSGVLNKVVGGGLLHEGHTRAGHRAQVVVKFHGGGQRPDHRAVLYRAAGGHCAEGDLAVGDGLHLQRGFDAAGVLVYQVDVRLQIIRGRANIRPQLVHNNVVARHIDNGQAALLHNQGGRVFAEPDAQGAEAWVARHQAEHAVDFTVVVGNCCAVGKLVLVDVGDADGFQALETAGSWGKFHLEKPAFKGVLGDGVLSDARGQGHGPALEERRVVVPGQHGGNAVLRPVERRQNLLVSHVGRVGVVAEAADFFDECLGGQAALECHGGVSS